MRINCHAHNKRRPENLEMVWERLNQDLGHRGRCGWSCVCMRVCVFAMSSPQQALGRLKEVSSGRLCAWLVEALDMWACSLGCRGGIVNTWRGERPTEKRGLWTPTGGCCCLGSSADILAKAVLCSTFVLGSHLSTLALPSSWEIVSKLEGLVFTISWNHFLKNT